MFGEYEAFTRIIYECQGFFFPPSKSIYTLGQEWTTGGPHAAPTHSLSDPLLKPHIT